MEGEPILPPRKKPAPRRPEEENTTRKNNMLSLVQSFKPVANLQSMDIKQTNHFVRSLDMFSDENMIPNEGTHPQVDIDYHQEIIEVINTESSTIPSTSNISQNDGAKKPTETVFAQCLLTGPGQKGHPQKHCNLTPAELHLKKTRGLIRSVDLIGISKAK